MGKKKNMGKRGPKSEEITMPMQLVEPAAVEMSLT